MSTLYQQEHSIMSGQQQLKGLDIRMLEAAQKKVDWSLGHMQVARREVLELFGYP